MLIRRRWEALTEVAIELLIRLCGISAILFVFGIFFFVFREGSGFLFHGFKFLEFFGSTEWYPTSQSHVRYGVLALIAGTASVTAKANGTLGLGRRGCAHASAFFRSHVP